MSLLSRISLTVLLARIEKHFVDAELGTFNLEEYIKELHPSPHPSPHSLPTSSHRCPLFPTVLEVTVRNGGER
jgi:hypothetical protein